MKTALKRRRKRWPHGPRYTVGSVTGSLITPGATGSGAGGGKRPMPVLWYVHDAAYCHKVIYEGWDRPKAEQIAAELNARAQA